MIRVLPMLVIALAALMLTGCATPVDWNARVGNYTYKQAVSDYGRPVSLTTLKNGSTVAEWKTKRGEAVVAPGPYVYGPGSYNGPYYGRGYYYGYYGPGWPNYSTTHIPAQFLRLEFGADGRLKAWKEYSK